MDWYVYAIAAVFLYVWGYRDGKRSISRAARTAVNDFLNMAGGKRG
jgi:hypothetical protein